MTSANENPPAIRTVPTRIAELFDATMQGDASAFAFALETLRAPCGPGPDFGLLGAGIRAGLGVAMWRTAAALGTDPDDVREDDYRCFLRRRKRRGRARNPAERLVVRAAEAGWAEAMPAADTIRAERALRSNEAAFLSPAERGRRRMRLRIRAWRFVGPLAGDDPSPPGPFLDDWARTGDEEGVAWLLHESMSPWKRDEDGFWHRQDRATEIRTAQPFRAELARAAVASGHPVARYFALYGEYDRLPLPFGPPLDEFAALCRAGEPLALASLARAVLGGDWRGDAYGPWRIAPNPLGVKDVPAFAEDVFRVVAANGGAWGCFYLGQMAWKRSFDRSEAIRARRGTPEIRLRYLDRDLRFLELPCDEADRWLRRGAAIGGPGAEECERTFAWREKARAQTPNPRSPITRP